MPPSTKYTVSAIHPGRNSIYCTLNVDKVSTKFMVDTGADISLLPADHAAVATRRFQCKQTMIQPVTVDGQPIPLLGTLDMEVELCGALVIITFFIATDPCIVPILGLDVMRRMETMEIDFSRGDKVTFGPFTKNKVPETEQSPAIRRISVKLREDIVVPARHQMITQGKLVAEDGESLCKVEQETLLMEPRSRESDNIIWGRSMVTSSRGNIPVRVCNPLGEAVTLHAGMSIGDVEPMPGDPVIAVVSDDVMTADSPPGGGEEVLKDLVKRAEVSEEEKLLLYEFLHQHRDAFSLHGELGKYEDSLFNIDTGNAAPIRCMPRTVPHHKKVEIDRQLDDMLQRGLIEPSDSPWASPVLLVKKKDGTMRFCIDYRKLNDISRHDSYPLPNINDCLASLGGHCEHFSLFDMATGYWQMGATIEAQEKAAFTTHRGTTVPW